MKKRRNPVERVKELAEQLMADRLIPGISPKWALLAQYAVRDARNIIESVDRELRK